MFDSSKNCYTGSQIKNEIATATKAAIKKIKILKWSEDILRPLVETILEASKNGRSLIQIIT